MKNRSQRNGPETAVNSQLPPTDEVLELLDADMDHQRREDELEDAVDAAIQPTEEEVQRYDKARWRIFEKLGIAEEVRDLLSVEQAIDQRVRAAIDELNAHRQRKGG
ncbi:MAG: hypothetical protein GVY32_05470 [Gammaproteobacteria bacterium]|jgi:hypothetical protein|nr:hypothetical protein [Gammaproteobacteria bacterium]